MTQNPSGIHPTEYNVLVKVEAVQEVTSGGVILADETKDRKQAFWTRGHIVAVSPLAFTYERWPEGSRVPQVGDNVLITKAAGNVVEGVDGEEYKLIKDKDINAVIGDPVGKTISAVAGTDLTGGPFEALDADIAALNAEAS